MFIHVVIKLYTSYVLTTVLLFIYCIYGTIDARCHLHFPVVQSKFVLWWYQQ